MRRSIHLSRLLVLALIALIAGAFLPTLTKAAPLDSEEQSFVVLINNYRQEHGLQPLKITEKLMTSSRWMSTDMSVKNYFSHTDSLGRDAATRLAAFGYAYNSWRGENLAAGHPSATDAFRQWKNSPEHNENMLNPNYVVMGVVRVYNADSTYKWYWTNDFGGYDDTNSAPAPAPAPTPVAVSAPVPTFQPATQLPLVPAHINVERQATGGAVVSWTPGDGGGAPASYQVQVVSCFRHTTTDTGVDAPCMQILLTSPTSEKYQVRVRAVNSAGPSEYSPWTVIRIRGNNGK